MEIDVYDYFDWPDDAYLGGPCFSVSSANFIREGVRVVIRDTDDQTVAGSGGLSGGELNYDHSGPDAESATDEEFILMLRCSFGVVIAGAQIDESRDYDVYVGNEGPVTFVGSTLLSGESSWLYFDVDKEDRREKLRFDQ